MNMGHYLEFTYVDNSTGYNHKKLWRVGDQDTTNLSTTPVGRYIEFTYRKQYDDGTAVTTSPQALLDKVRDVRGEYWKYRYHGYTTGELQADPEADFLDPSPSRPPSIPMAMALLMAPSRSRN